MGFACRAIHPVREGAVIAVSFQRKLTIFNRNLAAVSRDIHFLSEAMMTLITPKPVLPRSLFHAHVTEVGIASFLLSPLTG